MCCNFGLGDDAGREWPGISRVSRFPLLGGGRSGERRERSRRKIHHSSVQSAYGNGMIPPRFAVTITFGGGKVPYRTEPDGNFTLASGASGHISIISDTAKTRSQVPVCSNARCGFFWLPRLLCRGRKRQTLPLLSVEFRESLGGLPGWTSDIRRRVGGCRGWLAGMGVMECRNWSAYSTRLTIRVSLNSGTSGLHPALVRQLRRGRVSKTNKKGAWGAPLTHCHGCQSIYGCPVHFAFVGR